MSPRRSGPPQRRPRTEPARTSFRIYVEGQQTEEIYLTHWARQLRTMIAVDVAPFRGTPHSLVEHAVADKRTAERAAARGRGAAWNQVWCVFDRDEHPLVDEAIDLAARHGIRIAFSNPCLELWFVLHVRDQTAHVHRHEIQRLCRDLLGFDKVPLGSDLDALRSSVDEAKQRAKALDTKHAADGSPPRSNPSTSMWCLIDELRHADAGP